MSLYAKIKFLFNDDFISVFFGIGGFLSRVCGERVFPKSKYQENIQIESPDFVTCVQIFLILKPKHKITDIINSDWTKHADFWYFCNVMDVNDCYIILLYQCEKLQCKNKNNVVYADV